MEKIIALSQGLATESDKVSALYSMKKSLSIKEIKMNIHIHSVQI